MSRLPDRFDLWIRKAQASDDPVRQLDYVLGALLGLPEWHFFNIGTKENPTPAVVEIEDASVLLVFSSPSRLEDLLEESGNPVGAIPIITIPAASALDWCLERNEGLLVNQQVVIPVSAVKEFASEWKVRGGSETRGFWIPNMTSEEEDFWQEHGL